MCNEKKTVKSLLNEIQINACQTRRENFATWCFWTIRMLSTTVINIQMQTYYDNINAVLRKIVRWNGINIKKSHQTTSVNQRIFSSQNEILCELFQYPYINTTKKNIVNFKIVIKFWTLLQVVFAAVVAVSAAQFGGFIQSTRIPGFPRPTIPPPPPPRPTIQAILPNRVATNEQAAETISYQNEILPDGSYSHG